MSANTRPIDIAPVPVVDRTPLFKEDRPRHIDQFISFFGEEREEPSFGSFERLVEASAEP